MNKRMRKKKNKATMGQYIYLQGNNGGDFIEIKQIDDDKIHIFSGSSCVISINATVPIEFITKVVEKAMLDNNFDVKKIIDTFGWDKTYLEKLKSKCVCL